MSCSGHAFILVNPNMKDNYHVKIIKFKHESISLSHVNVQVFLFVNLTNNNRIKINKFKHNPINNWVIRHTFIDLLIWIKINLLIFNINNILNKLILVKY